MNNKVLILGGYGKAGSYIAELLLQNTNAKIVIAGRRYDNAADKANYLNNKFNTDRITPAKVNINNYQELKKSFKLCNLVIVSIPYKNNQGKNVIELAIKEEVNYIDLNADNNKYNTLEKYDSLIKEKGLVFLTEAGIVPGCPAMLAKLIGIHYDSINEIKISSLYRDRDIPYGGVFDIISHAGKKALVFENNHWQKTSPFVVRKIDFGKRFKKRISTPVFLKELEKIPDKFKVKKISLYQGGINPVADSIYFIWKVLNLSNFNSTIKLGSNLFLWANNKFTKPPFGVALKIEANGVKNGVKKNSSILLEHKDMYLATAIPVVASILKILEGKVEPGSDLMGYKIASKNYLDCLQELGMKVSLENLNLS